MDQEGMVQAQAVVLDQVVVAVAVELLSATKFNRVT
jgi:hypothetical protein